jgi:hypothetical protein
MLVDEHTITDEGPTPADDSARVLTPAGVMAALGIKSRDTLRRYLQSDRNPSGIPWVKLSPRKYRVRAVDLDRWLAAQVGATALPDQEVGGG